MFKGSGSRRKRIPADRGKKNGRWKLRRGRKEKKEVKFIDVDRRENTKALNRRKRGRRKVRR